MEKYDKATGAITVQGVFSGSDEHQTNRNLETVRCGGRGRGVSDLKAVKCCEAAVKKEEEVQNTGDESVRAYGAEE